MHKKTVFIVFVLVIYAIDSFGQNPWQQAKGEILLSPFVSTYKTNTFRDAAGTKDTFGNGGSYQHLNPKLYFSMAIKDYKLNLFGNIPFLAASFEDANLKQQNAGFSDIEIGLRKHLKKIGSYHYLMGSFSVYLPAYQNKDQPFIGLGKFGTELNFHLGGNFKFLNPNKNFHKVEAGVRLFFPNSATQYKLYVSQGYKFAPNWTLLAEANAILSRSNNNSFSIQNTQFITDFDLVKVALNIGYNVNQNLGFYVGAFQDVWNRNSSIGKGFQFFSIIKI